jgi:hypothetical protein
MIRDIGVAGRLDATPVQILTGPKIAVFGFNIKQAAVPS